MHALFCITPAAGNVTCPVEIKNTGNIRLQDISVDGDVNDCVFNDPAAPLWPAQTVSCSITR
jgi:hypothetical protein